MLFPELEINAGATFSPCKTYRYSLWRVWHPSKPLMGAILLNPSTADETIDDPTVHRMTTRAHSYGYGGLIVCNIFAMRSTDPEKLYYHTDPIGPDNDETILREMHKCRLVVGGWGQHGNYKDRGKLVVSMLRTNGIQPWALHVNKDGTPAHPLYLSYHNKPVEYTEAA